MDNFINSKRKYSISCVAVKEDLIYALVAQINFVLVIDKKSGGIKEILSIPREETIVANRFVGLYADKNDLLLVPQNAKKVWIYRIDLGKWFGIEISDYISEYANDKFSGGTIYNGKAYLFGYAYQGILTIDTNNYSIKEVLKKKDKVGFFSGINLLNINDSIYIPMRKKNKIICINSCTSEYQIRDIEDGGDTSDNPNDGLTTDGRIFYMLKNQGDFFVEISEKYCSREIKYENSIHKKSIHFEGIEYFNNKILFYGNVTQSYLVDLEQKQTLYINEPIVFAKKYDELGVIVCKKSGIEIWDFDAKCIKKYDLEVEEEILNETLSDVNLSGAMLSENCVFGLTEFLESIKR